MPATSSSDFSTILYTQGKPYLLTSGGASVASAAQPGNPSVLGVQGGSYGLPTGYTDQQYGYTNYVSGGTQQGLFLSGGTSLPRPTIVSTTSGAPLSSLQSSGAGLSQVYSTGMMTQQQVAQVAQVGAGVRHPPSSPLITAFSPFDLSHSSSPLTLPPFSLKSST